MKNSFKSAKTFWADFSCYTLTCYAQVNSIFEDIQVTIRWNSSQMYHKRGQGYPTSWNKKWARKEDDMGMIEYNLAFGYQMHWPLELF